MKMTTHINKGLVQMGEDFVMLAGS